MARFGSGLFVLMLAGFAGCSGGGDANTPEPPVVLTACDPVAQTGCSAGKKCTWIRISISSGPFIGALACTPAGLAEVGASCAWGAEGATSGYDDCSAGLVCRASPGTPLAAGTCTHICNSSDVTSCAPSDSWACMSYAGLFANGDDSPAAGLCDPQCNPLTQVRVTDGAAACGSPDPGNPTKGCYGLPSQGPHPSTFTCATAGAASKTSDVVVSPAFLNACAPGYIPLLRAATGSTDVICVAYCQPSDTTASSHPTPGGLSPHSCADKGAGGSHECRYWWNLEGDLPPASPWSNGLGYCIDYTRYTYSLGGPEIPYPSCTTLSDTAHTYDPTFSDGAYWGCLAR